MNLTGFRFWPNPTLMLAGGKGPAYWQQRQLAQSLVGLKAVQQICAWVNDWPVGYPRLHSGPFLGECLAGLTASMTDSSQSAVETTQPSQPLHGWPDRWRNLSNRESQPHSRAILSRNSFSSAQSARILPKPTRAKRSLQMPEKLQYSARGAALTSPPSQLQPRIDPLRLRQLAGPFDVGQSPKSSYGLRFPKASKKGAVKLSNQQRSVSRDWTYLFARQAQAVFNQAGLDLLRVSTSDSPDPPLLQAASALAEQWAVPLAGPSASFELLASLAGMSRRHGGISTSESGAESRSESASTFGRYRVSGSKLLHDSFAIAQQDNQKSNPVAPQTNKNIQENFLTVSSPETSAELPKNTANPEVSTHISPPLTASPLPQLQPPQIARVPAPTIATATIRQEAEQEPITADTEDLSDLAAKIKRILDQEARRHGIDV